VSNLLHMVAHASRHPTPAHQQHHRGVVTMLLASAPNLLYVLGIPGGSLVACVLICYGLYRILGRVLEP
jgi:hypothetical protein